MLAGALRWLQSRSREPPTVRALSHSAPSARRATRPCDRACRRRQRRHRVEEAGAMTHARHQLSIDSSQADHPARELLDLAASNSVIVIGFPFSSSEVRLVATRAYVIPRATAGFRRQQDLIASDRADDRRLAPTGEIATLGRRVGKIWAMPRPSDPSWASHVKRGSRTSRASRRRASTPSRPNWRPSHRSQ